MLKIIDRYILRAFFTNYLIAMAVMIGLYVILDLFVNLDEFTAIQSDTRLQTLVKIVDFYSHNLLLYFAQLSGVILLIAACFTFGRFLRTNELTALLASGASMYRVATPVLLAGLAMNGVWFFDQEVLIPRFADKLARKHADIEGRNSFAVWFQPDHDNALVSASMFHPRAREMRGLIILRRDDRGRMTEVLRADQARWDEERQLWHLVNGTVMRLSGAAQAREADLGPARVAEYASDLTPKELQLQQATQWTTFLSLPELDRLHQRFAESGTGEFIRMKHRRLTTVILNMIMLCLGIPFFLNRERPSVLVVGARCLLVSMFCYVLIFICHTVDFSAVIASPSLPAWIPVLVFAPVAVVLLDGVKT
jgi:lipopolysaccharide export system permease protein